MRGSHYNMGSFAGERKRSLGNIFNSGSMYGQQRGSNYAGSM